MLKEKILVIEEQMKLKLKEIRETFEQAGDKGTSVENIFRKFLRQYLPKRLDIGHGEVIDSAGRRSNQTDIVIVNEDHPFTFTSDQPGLFFIEGVCAEGEVKTNLTSKEFERTLRKSCQFKQLEAHPGKGSIAHMNPSDQIRFYRWPPYFLIAFESQLTLSHIQEKLAEFETQNSVEPNRLLDAVFILGQGWVINLGDAKGSFQYRRDKDDTSIVGWGRKTSDVVLFDFLAWLSIVMPKIVRFEPILPRYMIRIIKSEEKKT